MIAYNPKDWFKLLFNFNKADTFKKLLPLMVFIGFYATVIAFLEISVFKFGEASKLKNLTSLHTLLGFVLSMLLVFRTNTAYDRWWEGRKLWGSLVNSSRNFALKLNAILKPEDKANRDFFTKAISSYASVLTKTLAQESTRLLLDEMDHPELKLNANISHHPNRVASIIYNKIYSLKKEQLISNEELLFLNTELQTFTDVCGGCERIKNTPIPFSYSLFIKKFIFFYVMTIPFGYAFNLGYWMVPFVMFVFYVLASLELIAEEIEDPFNNDINDIPTLKISENIKRNVTEILTK